MKTALTAMAAAAVMAGAMAADPATPAATGTVLLVVADAGYQELELNGVRAAFEKAKYTVRIASKNGGEARGMAGGKAKADLKLADAKADGNAAVVFIGGPGCLAYVGDRDAERLARESAESSRAWGAICLAPNILAAAGVLKGKNATCFGSTDALKKGGAKPVAKPVVRDGNLVTADGPAAAAAFAAELLAVLGEKQTPAKRP